MKLPKLIVLFSLWVAGLAVSGCGPAPVSPTAAPTPEPTAAPTATTAPTGTPTPTEAPPEDTAAILRLGGYPCPDSDFTCVKLSVPLDHLGGTTDRRIDVVFGVLPATGERRGMFVTATGGPGYAGLASADDYTAAFDPRLTEHFDIVFFDQRGIGQSGAFQCVNAAVEFYRADWRTETPEQEAALIEVARTFTEDCLAEMGTPVEDLPFYSTRQAIEDLEVFRQAIGDEQLWLYGESYGTQYAQTYAAVYPEHLAGLILDGTVDLTLTGPEYYAGEVRGFSRTLDYTLEACAADEACAAALGGDVRGFFDDFLAEIAAAPASVPFPLPDGTVEQRPFTLSDLEYVITYELYSEAARLMLLRALAAAYRGDLTPMLRLLYVDLYVDPLTLEPIPYPDYSDAVYYTVECNDYNYYSGTPEERAEAMMREGDQIEAEAEYFESLFYGDLPCVFWPTPGEVERPAPLVAEGVPTLVLGATADPITWVELGQAVYSRLDDAYLITTEGGPHVIFGRGNACPDDLVTAFLVDGEMPAERETVCEGVVTDEYVPLSPTDASAFADPLEALIAFDTEFYYLPEYYYWDYETPTTVGCPFGGTLAFEITDAGEAYALAGCSFAQGFALTGTGDYDWEAGLFRLEVEVSGLASGTLVYTRDDSAGTYTVTGEYAGQPVDLSQ